MAFKQFGWVPDGTYDSSDYLVRYVLADGNATTVISMMWVNEGGPAEVDDSLKVSWGSFPDFPPKPPKK